MFTLSQRSRHSLLAACIALILFSSTSVAGRLCDQTFDSLTTLLLTELADFTPSKTDLHFVAEKGLHITMYCTFAILLWNALPSGANKSWVILISGTALGGLSELLQRFFPPRDPLIRDVFLNITGTTIGIALTIATLRLKRFSIATRGGRH